MIKIVLIGMKGCGKSTVGELLAEKFKIPFIELDSELEKAHFKSKKEKLTFREIYQKYGQGNFRRLETSVLKMISGELVGKNYVLACGGGTPLSAVNRKILIKLGKVIYLKPDTEALLERVITSGIPPFFSDNKDPEKSLTELLKVRGPIYSKLAHVTLNCRIKMPAEIITDIFKLL